MNTTIMMPPRQYAALLSHVERAALKPGGNPTILLHLIARRAEKAMYEFSRKIARSSASPST